MEDKMKIEELRFQVPWGHVAAKAWGSPQNFPVLLVHGISDNAGTFDRLIPLLPKNLYYVCIDLPNHGLSSDFPSGVPVEFLNYIFCIRILLDNLNWKSLNVIGHSYGALILLFYITLYPEKIKHFLSIDTALATGQHSRLPIDSFIRKSHSQALKHVISKDKPPQLFSRDEVMYALQCKKLNYATTESAQALFERTVTKIKNMYKYNHDPINLRPLSRPPVTLDQWQSYYEKCKVPILFIFSSNSRQHFEDNFPKEFEIYVKNRKNSQYVVVEGNHYVHLNHPERIAPYIEKILKNRISSKL